MVGTTYHSLIYSQITEVLRCFHLNWHVLVITTKHENRTMAAARNNAFSAHRSPPIAHCFR